MKSGIYAIYNRKSGKAYIGQSKDVERRKKEHLRVLRKGEHHNPYLQRAFNADGEESFEFITLELCPVEKLDEVEREYIARMQTNDSYLGYNIENGGNVGKDVSEKVREAKRGSNNPMYGKHISEEHIQSLRIKNRGHGSSLTEDQVAEIKQMLADQKRSCREIGEMFGVSRAVICKIKTGANWYWVREDLNEVITDEYIKAQRDKEVLDLYKTGLSRAAIAKRLGITPMVVTKIIGSPAEWTYENSKDKQKRRADVIHDFESGLSKEEIMQKHGINSAMYVKLTHDAYVARCEAEKEKAVEMRKSGMMVKDIAKKLGRGRVTISRWTAAVK